VSLTSWTPTTYVPIAALTAARVSVELRRNTDMGAVELQEPCDFVHADVCPIVRVVPEIPSHHSKCIVRRSFASGAEKREWRTLAGATSEHTSLHDRSFSSSSAAFDHCVHS
jgi:hypothetical protein